MKKLIVSASALTMGILISIAAPTSSQAAQLATPGLGVIQPYAAQGCSGDTCMYISTPSAGTVIVQGWAYSTTFTGYFRLTTPNATYYSATQAWVGGKGNYAQWSGISAVVGQYCVSGYTSGGTFEGTACENVS